MLKWLRSRIHNLVERKSNKNKKNTVIININRAKEQRLKKKCGEWVGSLCRNGHIYYTKTKETNIQ